MNEEQKASHDIRKLLNTFKGLLNLAPGLEDLGSIKQAEIEARDRLAIANTKADEAQITTKEMIAKAEEDVKKIFDNAAAEVFKFQTKVKEAEERLAAINAETATVQARYIEAKAMLDDIVKRVRG